MTTHVEKNREQESPAWRQEEPRLRMCLAPYPAHSLLSSHTAHSPAYSAREYHPVQGSFNGKTGRKQEHPPAPRTNPTIRDFSSRLILRVGLCLQNIPDGPHWRPSELPSARGIILACLDFCRWRLQRGLMRQSNTPRKPSCDGQAPGAPSVQATPQKQRGLSASGGLEASSTERKESPGAHKTLRGAHSCFSTASLSGLSGSREMSETSAGFQGSFFFTFLDVGGDFVGS
jgi:hypothetical protein